MISLFAILISAAFAQQPGLLPDLPAPSLAVMTPVVHIDWDHPPMTSIKDKLINDAIDPVTADRYEKLILREARKQHVPADILFSAIYQESDYQQYGINEDYGNFSCGISQFNIADWCSVVRRKSLFGWPTDVSCDEVEDNNEKIVGPFLSEISAAHALPSTGTEPDDFLTLSKEHMISLMPQPKFYAAAMSFGLHCSDPEMNVIVMANALKSNYRDSVPSELKRAHPHTAWVLADAIYNMGPALVDVLEQNGADWKTLTPQIAVDILSKVYATKPAGATTETTFQIHNEDDGWLSVKYFMLCVNQRHITSIMRAAMPDSFYDAIHWSTENCGN